MKNKIKIIVKNAIKRKKDKLYYIDKDGNLLEAIPRRGRKPKQKNKRKYTTQKQKEEMEF